MTNPHLAGGIERDARGRFARVMWEPGTGRGAELSRDYFASVRVDTAVDDAGVIAESASLVGEREIRIELADAPSANAVIRFRLLFDDRRRHLDCRHPGMDDVYALSVTIALGPSGEVTSSDLQERVGLGAL